MRFTPRPYQQDAIDKAIDHVRKCTSSCLLVLGCGAGKSLIIAELAEKIHALSGKKILCLAPSMELVLNNRQKFLATGNPASLYSASAGGKDLRHNVVFGSPITVLNSIEKFKKGFAAVIIDECFHPDTMIKTKTGYLRISDPDLINNDIACFDKSTGEVVFNKPKKVWYNGTKKVSQLNHSRGSVICTNTHKFYIKGSWQQAGDLRAGQIMTLEDSQAFVLKKLLRALAAVTKKLWLTLVSDL